MIIRRKDGWHDWMDRTPVAKGLTWTVEQLAFSECAGEFERPLLKVTIGQILVERRDFVVRLVKKLFSLTWEKHLTRNADGSLTVHRHDGIKVYESYTI